VTVEVGVGVSVDVAANKASDIGAVTVSVGVKVMKGVVVICAG
jgi:hypothetical protein